MYSTEYLLDETIPVTNDRDCYIVANFTTVHKSFQSVVILLERGLQDDVLSLLRSIFEDDNYYYIETISTMVIILLELICAHFSFSQDNIEKLNLEKKQIWNEV